jgi:parallel beta-helix repeat protein
MIPNRKAFVFIGLLVIAGTVHAATFINTCPFVITSPGDYLLSADLNCAPGGNSLGAIVIASSDVTLKLEGHRITLSGPTAAAINVQLPFSGVVERVHILGPGLITTTATFGEGLALYFLSDSEVSGVTVLGSESLGIFAFSCNFLTITGNTVARNNTGIWVQGNSNTISKNDASGNAIGIFINNQQGGSTNNTASHNILNGNTIDGLEINFGPFFPGSASAQNNVTKGNGQHGIFLATTVGMNVEVSNNTSLANGMFDLFDFNPGCSGHSWSGNTFFTANQSCIH